MKNTWVSFVIVAVVFGGGGFYAGMQYSKSTSSPTGGTDQGINQGGPSQGRLGRGGAGGNRVGDVAFGEVIAKDKKSITVKLQDGGSKIVFVGAGADIGKFDKATLSDLIVGTNVMTRGSANTDGSFTAQSVQIRPAGALFSGQNNRGQ